MADPVLIAAPTAAAAVEIAKAPAAITIAGYAMLGLGVVLIAMLVFIFAKVQRGKSKFDFEDLLIDWNIGKTTQGRFWGMIGGTAGTFVFVYLPVSGHFDSTYAVGYLVAAWGLKVAGDITGKPASPAPGSSESIERINRVGAPADAAAAAAIAAISPAPSGAELLSAGRGVELRPAIGKEDVGKEVALVSKRNRTKPKPRKRRK